MSLRQAGEAVRIAMAMLLGMSAAAHASEDRGVLLLIASALVMIHNDTRLLCNLAEDKAKERTRP